MGGERSDAFVFFGATGDLAFKQIFPAPQGLIRDGGFDMPIIGVARSGDLDTLRERAGRSVEGSGGADPKALSRLIERLRYVKGSNDDLETFHALRRELGDAEHPLHYLAIPPVLFTDVIANLAAAGCAEGGAGDPREAVRARPCQRARPQRHHSPGISGTVDLPDRPLPRQRAGAEPPLLPVRQLVHRAALEPRPHRQRPDHDG